MQKLVVQLELKKSEVSMSLYFCKPFPSQIHTFFHRATIYVINQINIIFSKDK